MQMKRVSNVLGRSNLKPNRAIPIPHITMLTVRPEPVAGRDAPKRINLVDGLHSTDSPKVEAVAQTHRASAYVSADLIQLIRMRSGDGIRFASRMRREIPKAEAKIGSSRRYRTMIASSRAIPRLIPVMNVATIKAVAVIDGHRPISTGGVVGRQLDENNRKGTLSV